MTDTLPPPPPGAAVEAQPKKKVSCWAVGCGGCLLVLLILIGFGIYIFNSLFDEPFEPLELAPAEKEQMDLRLDDIEKLQTQAEQNGENWIPAEGFRVTEQEINYWMSKESGEAGDAVRVDFEPGEIYAEIRTGEPGSDKRIKLGARVTVKEGPDGLDIRIVDVKVGKISLPKSVLEALASENLAQEMIDDPEVQNQLENSIGGVEILKDAILLLPPKAE